jgi:hypothetical protein
MNMVQLNWPQEGDYDIKKSESDELVLLKMLLKAKEQIRELTNRPINTKKICCLCKHDVDDLVDHHYSYFPEKIMLVCRSCNSRAVMEKNHPALQPSLNDAKRFYGEEYVDGED